MNKLTSFVQESIEEMRYKVSWPKFDSLQRDSRLVLVASLIFALLIGLVDFGFSNIMSVLYNL
jgi:preprotein translocase subunit SecE